MQISAGKSSPAFSASPWSLAIGGRIRRLLAKASSDLPLLRFDSHSVDVDSVVLESLYRSARLLVPNDAAAGDLILETYKKADAGCLFSSPDRAKLRLQLFECLYSVFQQVSDKHSWSGVALGTQNGNSRAVASVGDLIRQQEPAARLMIFLRHCENLPIDQISFITHHARNAVQSHLLRFRLSLQALFCDSRSQSPRYESQQ